MIITYDFREKQEKSSVNFHDIPFLKSLKNGVLFCICIIVSV